MDKKKKQVAGAVLTPQGMCSAPNQKTKITCNRSTGHKGLHKNGKVTWK